MAPQDFGRSVNPFSTSGTDNARLCNYKWQRRIFRPSIGPELVNPIHTNGMASLLLSVSKSSKCNRYDKPCNIYFVSK